MEGCVRARVQIDTSNLGSPGAAGGDPISNVCLHTHTHTHPTLVPGLT